CAGRRPSRPQAPGCWQSINRLLRRRLMSADPLAPTALHPLVPPSPILIIVGINMPTASGARFFWASPLACPFFECHGLFKLAINLSKPIWPRSAALGGGAFEIREMTVMADQNHSPTTDAQNGTEIPPRKRGGGVRTEAGKANSRRNALKGSLRAK